MSFLGEALGISANLNVRTRETRNFYSFTMELIFSPAPQFLTFWSLGAVGREFPSRRGQLGSPHGFEVQTKCCMASIQNSVLIFPLITGSSASLN